MMPWASRPYGPEASPREGTTTGGCCGPHRSTTTFGAGEQRLELAPHSSSTRQSTFENSVTIPSGVYRIGGEESDTFPDDGEGPVRDVLVNSFVIDRFAVTNTDFSIFVDATNYTTDAERFAWSYVFYAQVHPLARGAVLPGATPDAPWWLPVEGATWRTPFGPGSSIEELGTHPVVHVSWRDAQAYCHWAGKRLPTEAEWEIASRGGLQQNRFPWGQELTPGGSHRCNIWQGVFPSENTGEDGFLGTAPVDAFMPNGYGLYNTSGNVWEWCEDWWSNDWHIVDCPETRRNPTGPSAGSAKVIRGGSYLCHAEYCNRYRVCARTSNTPDSSTGHMGFRCVWTEPLHKES